MRGDVITVDGANLSGSTRVLFNGVEAAFNEVSNTRLQTTVPALATTGRQSASHFLTAAAARRAAGRPAAALTIRCVQAPADPIGSGVSP